RRQAAAMPSGRGGRLVMSVSERKSVVYSGNGVHEKYKRLLEPAKTLLPLPTAIAYPCDESSLTAAVDAARNGLVAPLLVGPGAPIKAVAEKSGLDLAGLEIVEALHSQASAALAVEPLREGRAEEVTKGSLHTDELTGEVVKRDTGLRTARRISHCFV